MQTRPAQSEPAARLAAVRQLLQAGDKTGAEQAALELCEDHPELAAAHALCARCGLGHALMNLGQSGAAEAEFNAALAEGANELAARAGLALLASRTNPSGAEALWQQLYRAAPGPPKPHWELARARAFVECGELDRAYAIVRQVAGATPGNAAACRLLAMLLIRQGRRADAAEALASGVLRPDGALDGPARLSLQSWLGDVRAAREGFAALLETAGTPAALTGLFDLTPQIFESFDRTRVWTILRSRAAGLSGDSAAVCLQLRLDLALRDYDAFLARHAAAPSQPAPWAWRFQRVAAALQAPAFPDFAAPKVFGIGLTKTGTTSLGRALERLGYFHAHFNTAFGNDVLTEADFPLYDAATDTPVSMRFETLYMTYPNARFILTERPFDQWETSLTRDFERRYGTADFARLRQLSTIRNGCSQGLELALVHGALYFGHATPRAAYLAHIRRVEQFFADKPAGKLLRHNAFTGDGWPELCGFLGCEVPPEPYPWGNRSVSAMA